MLGGLSNEFNFQQSEKRKTRLTKPCGAATVSTMKHKPRSFASVAAFLVVASCLTCLFDPCAACSADVIGERSESGGISINGLRCNYQADPLGVEDLHPALSWLLEFNGHNGRQSAYQVLVASTEDLLRRDVGDLWNSGKVLSGESVHIRYGGSTLQSRMRCCWKARAWDSTGRVSQWSKPGFWEMGLLRREDWKASWIGSGPLVEPRPAGGFFRSTNELPSAASELSFDGRATLLRKEFIVRKQIRRARAFVTGLGYYELTCNGERIGDNVLAPAKSNYRKWAYYDCYDVSSQIRQGTNALGIMLGNGWFNPYPKWWDPYRMQWFGSKRAIFQMHLDYSDGSSELIVSDSSWKTTPGPVIASCVYDGEEYDAREERPGWDRPGYSEEGWKRANVVEPPGGELVSSQMPPIRVIERLKPVRVNQPKPGVYVFDFGQNFSGWARLEVSGPRGTRVRLRYAEDLLPDGNVDRTSNEHAEATDIYVLKGGGKEVYEPHFTFHGFQFLEITGYPGEPELTNVIGCVVHSACKSTGSFSSSNDLLNRIHRATVWSQRSNLMGYPMDCPQRDERLGWFGDAMVSMEEAMFNFDMPAFYRQWLEGVKLNQNPANGDISIISPRPYTTEEPDPTWSSAFVVMNWQYYLQYGDTEFLARQYQAMKAYVDFLGTQATNHILPKYWIGDWGSIVKNWKEGEPVLVGTAFYFYDARILAQAAKALGHAEDAHHYSGLAGDIKDAFNRQFYESAGHRYGEGTQFSNGFPLFLGLVDASNEGQVLQNILDGLERKTNHFDVGVLGAKYLIDCLSAHGRPDVAFTLATNTGYPSWSHMVAEGRSTLSEFWDLHGSHNHVMMGSIDGWFYRVLAGIEVDPVHPGFEHFFIRPFIPKSLSSAAARVETVRGPISVAWNQTNGILELRATIPANTSATVSVPTVTPSKVTAEPPIPLQQFTNGTAIYEVGSGHYVFQSRP
jgi:alpha-L-rhamnosidase